MRRRSCLPVALVALLVLGTGCSDDDEGASPATTTTAAAADTTVPNDPSLEPLLVQLAELPNGFERAQPEGDTVPTFCFGVDATAGLRATGRAIAIYAREADPKDQSILHIVFRFADDGADTFVRQAREALEQCHEVPDVGGLAFSFSPASTGLEAALAETDDHIARHGSQVGSGLLQEEVAVFRRGEVGHFVVVVTRGRPAPELEALALTVFTAAADQAP